MAHGENATAFLKGFTKAFGKQGGFQKLSSYAARNIDEGKYYEPFKDPVFLREYKKAAKMGPRSQQQLVQKYQDYFPANTTRRDLFQTEGGSGTTPEEAFYQALEETRQSDSPIIEKQFAQKYQGTPFLPGTADMPIKELTNKLFTDKEKGTDTMTMEDLRNEGFISLPEERVKKMQEEGYIVNPATKYYPEVKAAQNLYEVQEPYLEDGTEKTKWRGMTLNQSLNYIEDRVTAPQDYDITGLVQSMNKTFNTDFSPREFNILDKQKQKQQNMYEQYVSDLPKFTVPQGRKPKQYIDKYTEKPVTNIIPIDENKNLYAYETGYPGEEELAGEELVNRGYKKLTPEEIQRLKNQGKFVQEVPGYSGWYNISEGLPPTTYKDIQDYSDARQYINDMINRGNKWTNIQSEIQNINNKVGLSIRPSYFKPLYNRKQKKRQRAQKERTFNRFQKNLDLAKQLFQDRKISKQDKQKWNEATTDASLAYYKGLLESGYGELKDYIGKNLNGKNVYETDQGGHYTLINGKPQIYDGPVMTAREIQPISEDNFVGRRKNYKGESVKTYVNDEGYLVRKNKSLFYNQNNNPIYVSEGMMGNRTYMPDTDAVTPSYVKNKNDKPSMKFQNQNMNKLYRDTAQGNIFKSLAYHKVMSGQNLKNVANMYNTTKNVIKKLNPQIPPSGFMEEGDVLNVPRNKKSAGFFEEISGKENPPESIKDFNENYGLNLNRGQFAILKGLLWGQKQQGNQSNLDKDKQDASKKQDKIQKDTGKKQDAITGQDTGKKQDKIQKDTQDKQQIKQDKEDKKGQVEKPTAQSIVKDYRQQYADKTNSQLAQKLRENRRDPGFVNKWKKRNPNVSIDKVIDILESSQKDKDNDTQKLGNFSKFENEIIDIYKQNKPFNLPINPNAKTQIRNLDNVNRIMIHQEVAAGKTGIPAIASGIRKWISDEGSPGYPYHYLVDTSGQVFHTRADRQQVGAAQSTPINKETLHIVVPQTITSGKNLTNKQKTQLKNLTKYLSQKYNIPQKNIVAHGDMEDKAFTSKSIGLSNIKNTLPNWRYNPVKTSSFNRQNKYMIKTEGKDESWFHVANRINEKYGYNYDNVWNLAHKLKQLNEDKPFYLGQVIQLPEL